jgi:hypothetical protein
MMEGNDRLTRLRELIRRCEDVALALFGLVMLLICMWEILRKHLGL